MVEIKKQLNKIKIIVGYLKRKSSLIIKGEENCFINSDEIKIIFNESFNDLKSTYLSGAVYVEKNISISIEALSKFYQFYHNVVLELLDKNLQLWITINLKQQIEFAITFVDTKLEKNLFNFSKEQEINYEWQDTLDGTKILIKEDNI